MKSPLAVVVEEEDKDECYDDVNSTEDQIDKGEPPEEASPGEEHPPPEAESYPENGNVELEFFIVGKGEKVSKPHKEHKDTVHLEVGHLRCMGFAHDKVRVEGTHKHVEDLVEKDHRQTNDHIVDASKQDKALIGPGYIW